MTHKIIITISAMCIATNISAHNLQYPQAPKAQVTDEYFGTSVQDPYRPLENDTCQITADWVKAENEVSQSYLSQFLSVEL